MCRIADTPDHRPSPANLAVVWAMAQRLEPDELADLEDMSRRRRLWLRGWSRHELANLPVTYDLDAAA
jgi:hypothetical protein